MGKKIIAFLITLAAFAGVLAGCSKYKVTPLAGDYTSALPASDNGGFVTRYGDYIYFINGIDYTYSDNTFGKPVKAALMRVKADQLFSETAEFQTVVPRLMISGTQKQGFYISGDYVYYATPTTAKDKKGEVQSSFLDITSTKLDGTGTRKTPYFRLESNLTDYRFVEIDSVIYVVYEEDGTLYSYDTAAHKKITLAKDASVYTFPLELNSKYYYYTKDVKVSPDNEDSTQLEKFNELYRVSADGAENKRVLSGKGFEAGEGGSFLNFENKKITVVKANDRFIYLSIAEEIKDGNSFYAILDTNELSFEEGKEVEDFNKAVRIEDKDIVFSAETLFIGAETLLYKGAQGIMRYDVDGESTVAILKSTESLSLLYADGDLLYYSKAGGSGSNLFRIKFDGEEKDYEPFYNLESEILPEQIGEIEFASGWYKPKILDGVLFYANAGELGYNYIFAFDLEKAGEEEYEPTFIGKRNDSDKEAYEEALLEKQEQEENEK